MTYIVKGLLPELFDQYRGLDDEALSRLTARRVTATSKPGFPCRVSLEDAEEGEELILLHHVSHDTSTPYRSAYAIYIRESAVEAASYRDTLPPAFANRPLAMRAFSSGGMLTTARLALPGQVEATIFELLADQSVAYIDVHNAAHGCFAARVERD